MKERINKILHALNENLIEREEVIQLALLATIAGESIFLLGPPGVAKSLIARRLKHVFKSGKSFEYLMNRFSSPDEIFGPVAISKLKEHDIYERKTEKYLPWADVVFLDEIWKAGPSIQNSLLTAINEKIYRNGHQEEQIKLKGLISASNELPTKGEGLEALWDRFIIRYFVTNITNPQKFNDFLKSNFNPFDIELDEKDKISEDDYKNWQKEISEILISDEALNVINVIRHYINEYNKKEETENPIYISDRRWKKIIRILQTSAFLNDRIEIDLMDCFLISHTLWNEIEHIKAVTNFVEDAIKKHGYSLKFNLSYFSQDIQELKDDIDSQTKKAHIVSYFEPQRNRIGNSEYYELIDDNGNLVDVNYNKKYQYLKISDFNSLSKTKLKPISLSDANGKEKSGYQALKVSDNQIKLVLANSRYAYGYRNSNFENNFEFVSNKKEKREYKTVRPHKAIINEWNKKIQSLKESIDKTIKEIESYKKKELAGLKNNIFVSRNHADIPEYNLNQTIQQLYELKITADKLKNEYESIY